ncbi:MAG TPA: protein kinase [Polyangia bacterium]
MSASRSNGFVHEQTPARPSEPQELGRYLLLERIGGGGMAEIFRGTTIGADNFRRNVVIKRMLPELTNDETFMKMFVDEANICAQLNHPNIVHVHELGVHLGQYFMVMEEINGVDLGRAMKYLTDHGLGVPPCIVADIGRQLTRGLSYAHSMSVDGTPMRIVHRDITPTNVMIASTGVIKILDFGIARAAEAFRIGRTSAGEIKGKCAYLSPEQLALAPIDHRVDIFAAGVLLHELLLGRRLFKAETPWATIQAVSEMPIPRPSQVDHRIPVQLEEIVLKMLARNPAERYQEAGQIADALDAFLVKQQYQSHELLTFAMDICQAVQPPRRPAPAVGTPARIAVKANVSVVQAPQDTAATDGTAGEDGGNVLSASQVSMVLEEPVVAAPVEREKSGSLSSKPKERQLNSERRPSRRSGSSRIQTSAPVAPEVVEATGDAADLPFEVPPEAEDALEIAIAEAEAEAEREAADRARAAAAPSHEPSQISQVSELSQILPPFDDDAKTYVDPEPSMVMAAWGHTARLDLLKSFGPIPSEKELATAKPGKLGASAKDKGKDKSKDKSTAKDKDASAEKPPKRKYAAGIRAKDKDANQSDDVEKTEDIGPITRIIRNTLARRVLTGAILAHTLWITFGPQQPHGLMRSAAAVTTQAPAAEVPGPVTATPSEAAPPGRVPPPARGTAADQDGTSNRPSSREVAGAVEANPMDGVAGVPGTQPAAPPGERSPRGLPSPFPTNEAPAPTLGDLPAADTLPRAGEYDSDDLGMPPPPSPRSKPSTFKKVRHALPVDPFSE